MAFPSDIGSKQDDLSRAWASIRSIAGNIKTQSTILRDTSAAGSIEASRIVSYSVNLANMREQLARFTAVPGLVAYVRTQVNDPTIDVVAEYNTMLIQLNATRTWIVNNFPKDANGYILYHQLDSNGKLVQRLLTPAQTAGLRSELTNLINTID